MSDDWNDWNCDNYEVTVLNIEQSKRIEERENLLKNLIIKQQMSYLVLKQMKNKIVLLILINLSQLEKKEMI